jgi:hypothetical protein
VLVYSELEKMIYAVVMVARKLKHYFQSYSITIPTSYPLREIFVGDSPEDPLRNRRNPA